MSRETDSSYPPGNEPDEPKTETTLTTRIRINIPGSRPIPPVVMRTPVNESDTGKQPVRQDSDEGASGGGADGQPSRSEESPEPSSWFAPRKAPSEQTPPRGTATGGAQAVSRRDGTPPGGTPAFGAQGPPPGHQGPPPGHQGPSPSHQGPPLGQRSPLAGPPAGSGMPPGYPMAGGQPGADQGDLPLLPPEFQLGPDGHRPPPGLTPPPGADRGLSDSDLGETVAGGIPVVPPSGHHDQFPLDGPGDAPSEPVRPEVPAPVPAARPPAKGRSKLVLLGAAVLGVLGIAYGVGLLLDHADVPKGTTVLGVDIGGTTKQEAVSTLDAQLGERTTAPLVISVGGSQQQLKPSVAGLSLDTETTVRDASGRDYNPLSVIGSLFGGSRAAEPAFTVDEEKLKAALAGLGGEEGGAAKDGMVTFKDGKAVAVPGTARAAVDPEKSASAVESAYRQRAATGQNDPVTLPVGKQEPKVTEQELQRAVKEFGEPAMSGLVTVRAGTAEISFSPERSLPQFLSMRATKDGKLVDHYDLAALKELYGSTFEGIEITRGNGSKTAVTPQDVAGALRPALTETDPAKRVGVIPLDPQ
ncbi:hypothetical protein QNO07_22985 [Streptomyces sp. 549]|uniref:hypothetical protein n=1 Tax=Streptomyces sp. 549 TaxID=3049076 RepID=UPI0024C2180F|nr:hypothetical protein [Streptomyces sp. 549]MDK1476248.1 hypothetical protein [Streptomyces sp. 549]